MAMCGHGREKGMGKKLPALIGVVIMLGTIFLVLHGNGRGITFDAYGIGDIQPGPQFEDVMAASIAIPPLNGLSRAENRERFNVFSATGETDLKVNCYINKDIALYDYTEEYEACAAVYPLIRLFSITHVITADMEPFIFCSMSREGRETEWGDILYDIAAIYVTGPWGQVIQVIEGINNFTIAEWEIERGEYRVLFGDFNHDGYLDIILNGWFEPVYSWVWNPDYGRFKPWEFTPPENGEIDFSVAQSIHPDMPPFIFRMLGGYRPFPYGYGYYSRMVDTIRITYLNGELLQEITGFYAWARLSASNRYGLHFADYNFDGYLDIALHMWPGGTRDAGYFYYWLWCRELRQFVFNRQLSHYMRGNGNINVNNERRQIQAWASHVGGRHNVFYEYAKGVFTPVEYLFWEFYHFRASEWSPPEGEFNVRITRRDLVGGGVEVWYEYWEG